MKTKTILAVAFGLLFGCENQKEVPSELAKNVEAARYEKISSELILQFSDSFNNIKKVKPLTITKLSENTGSGKLEKQKLIVSSGEYLAQNYYKDFKISNATLLYQEGVVLANINNARTSGDAAVAAINDIPTLNDEQKSLMNSLVSEVSALSDINGTISLIASYNEKVVASPTLNEEQKVQLLAFSALSASFVKFMNEGGVEDIYSLMAKELGVSDTGTNARVYSGCTVNWRSVWAGAVIGGAVGAIGGAKAGLAGGTIALPGIGSATGAVGGAVLGGAGGFLGGTVTGVATELLTSCFRNIQSVDVLCKNFFDRYLNGEVSAMQIPDECMSNIQIKSKEDLVLNN